MSRHGPPGRWHRRPESDRIEGAGSAGAADAGQDARHEGWMLPGVAPDDLEPDPTELREFLAADLLPAEADPVFKERLRVRLWRMVQARYGRPSGEDGI